ncbi:MAG: ATP-binding cassette domain-containing protein, partial [Cyanobacteria bacterium]|nr:ATP-binding cassette domain-containing protein [Cyanobacteriota bacterium]
MGRSIEKHEMNYLLDVQNVTVSYLVDKRETKTVLNDISLRVREGEFVTVIGPSGCGKSTLLRLVLGAQFPTRGTVLIDGKKVNRVTRDAGIVYQSYSLFPHLTVVENIMLGPILEQTSLTDRLLASPFSALSNLRGRRRAAQELAKNSGRQKSLLKYFSVRAGALEGAMALLKDIGLDEHDGDKYPYELSGGMRQRVAIAQALIMNPKILLMDEPFGALDLARREEMQDFIFEQSKSKGITVFFVTHDVDEAVKLGTRLVCLSQYYTDREGGKANGARFVIDRKVMGGLMRPSIVVDTDEFRVLTKQIGKTGLDPNYLQP